MQALLLALLVGAIFTLFSTRVQGNLRRLLHASPSRLFFLPVLLTGIFALAAAASGALSFSLVFLVAGYTLAPASLAFVQGAGFKKSPGWLDFAVILLLWLPLEFAAGQHLVPKAAQGFLHSVAYGLAIILGLVLFLGFRSFEGLKYNLPRGPRDWVYPLIGFLITAPLLIALGIALGFIPLPHLPRNPSGARFLSRFAVIFIATALPEEILFRSLIQNLLMQKLGRSIGVLLLASVIFGLAHLDNGPQATPNWRYAILATIAGVGYGKVFDKSSTVFSSVFFHALVDWTKHFFF